MKSPYLLAALLAVGLAGCKTEVSTTPTTTKVEVKPVEPTTTVVVPPPPPSTTETTKSTTVTTPSGSSATQTTTTTETKK
jgi:hypothetical protein